MLGPAPHPQDFLPWFSSYTKMQSNNTLVKWHTLPASPSGSSDALLFLTPTDGSKTPEWRHIQVIGRFYEESSHDYQDGLLSLCGSAQRIFISQPTRFFLHGFYLRGSLIELWAFDRSGLCCSQVIDYSKEFHKFIGILLCYENMSEKDFGVNPLIATSGTNRYVMAGNEDWKVPGHCLLLDDEPLAFPEEIIGNGTTCYRARVPSSTLWEYAVKFKWRLAQRDRPEEDMLKLIKMKDVWGVISFQYCKEVASTAALRDGLRSSRYRKLSNTKDQYAEISDQPAPQSILESTMEINNRFEDRICSCIITSPPGRPLRTFKSILELLEVLRDAIKGHRSLLQKANILHQDISPGNIIITDAQEQGRPKGILIDFDVAMDLAVGPRTPGEVTGTRPFMAVGILLGRRHWYWHDLESFLYVLLWSIITDGSESPPRNSKLRMWSRGDWDDIAARKTAEMEEAGFGSILAEFPEKFESLKQLAESVRRILFPIVDGAVWTGTDNNSDTINSLYDGIVGAFEHAIALESAKL
ncbi:hypothetical protein V2G26_002785 [Clonostachys chloroleuca]